jgi:gamma-glutamylcyclotransferase (GGCT)/AIG2-like uncharacterized protein YtfP/cation transport regulator ChaC
MRQYPQKGVIHVHYVFVYGTLRRQERNHCLLEKSACISVYARANGQLIDTGLGYPGFVEEEGTVIGELYAVTEETLQRLDVLEGYYGPEDPRNLYERKEIDTMTDKGTFHAWTYIYCEDAQRFTRFTDWKLKQLEKESSLMYFAYGSCADTQRIDAAGKAEWFREVTGMGVLDGFTLQFTKYSPDGNRADVIELGGEVEGKLYHIPSVALTEYLYGREGVRSGAYRPIIVPIMLPSKPEQPLEAVTFAAIHKSEELPPPQEYMEEVLRGLKPVVSKDYYEALLGRFVNQVQLTAKGVVINENEAG